MVCFSANSGFMGVCTSTVTLHERCLNDSATPKWPFYGAMWHKGVVDSNKIYITLFTPALRRLAARFNFDTLCAFKN